jgi:excisionase family DNA binding protein
MTDPDDEGITMPMLPVGPRAEAGATGNAPRPACGDGMDPSCESPPAVLTVDELAALLRVNRKTVYDALARDAIPGARRIGKTYRILRAAVLEWLASSQDRVARSRRIR